MEKKLRIKYLFTLTVFIFTWSFALSQKAWYVDPSGSNSKSGSLSQPLKNIQAAIDSCGLNDTVVLKKGVFYPKNQISFGNKEIVLATYNNGLIIDSFNAATILYGDSLPPYTALFKSPNTNKTLKLIGLSIRRLGHSLFNGSLTFSQKNGNSLIRYCALDSCEPDVSVDLLSCSGSVNIEYSKFRYNKNYNFIINVTGLSNYSNPNFNPYRLKPVILGCDISDNIRNWSSFTDKGIVALLGGAIMVSNVISNNSGTLATALFYCGNSDPKDTIWFQNNTVVKNQIGLYAQPWWGGVYALFRNNYIYDNNENLRFRRRQNGNSNDIKASFENNYIYPFLSGLTNSSDTSVGYLLKDIQNYSDNLIKINSDFRLSDNSKLIGMGKPSLENWTSISGIKYSQVDPTDIGAYENIRIHSQIGFSSETDDVQVTLHLDSLLQNPIYDLKSSYDSIRVYRNGTLISTVSSSVRDIIDKTGLSNDSTYSYVLEGFNVVGQVGASSVTQNVIPHTRPGLPDRDKVKTESGAYKVLISWPAVKSSYGPIRYKLFRRAVPNIDFNFRDTTKFELVTATTDTFFVDGLDLSNPLSKDSFYVYFLTTIDSLGSTSDNKEELLAFKYEKPGNTIFVSTSGSDSNLIASAAYPLRTLKRAVDFTRTDPFTNSNHEYNRFRDYIISLSAGTFDEKGIRIRDSNVNNIEIRGQLNQTILKSSDTNTHLFYITTSFFRGKKSFKGLTFKGIKKALWLDGGGPYIFENCRFEENGYKYGGAGSSSGGSIATHYANTTFTNCIFRNNYNSLFGLDGNDTFVGMYVRFNYCVLVDNRSLSGSISNGKPSWPGNNQMYNSIIWNSSASVQTDISGLGFELYNCILKDDLSKRTNSAATCSKCYFIDPQFENISSGDFRLKNSSPALSLGSGLFGNLPGSYTSYYNGEMDSSLVHLKDPTTDYLGNERPKPNGSSSDLGAYESTKGNTPLLLQTIGSDKKINIEWSHNNFSTIDKVYIAKSDTAFGIDGWGSNLYDSVSINTRNYLDSGLVNKKPYYYRIITANPDTGLYFVSDLFLAYSNIPLSKLDSVKAYQGANQAYLDWAVNDTAESYRIEIFEGNTVVKIDTTFSHNYRDTQIVKTRRYVIRAIDSFGVLGIASDTLAVTPLSNVWVDANYSGFLTLGTQQNPVKTVQQAYNWALSEDTIYIEEGRYRFNLVDRKGLIFFSLGGVDSVFFRSKVQSEPIIKTEHSSSINTVIKNITFDSNEVVIYNFFQPTLIDGCRFVDGLGNNGLIRGHNSRLKIQNCLFLNCRRLFYFDQKDSSLGGALLDYCTFINVDLMGTAWDHPSSSGKIHILNSIFWDSSRSNIQGLYFENEQLEFSNCMFKGISDQYQSDYVNNSTKVRFDNHSFQSGTNNKYELAPYSLGSNKGTTLSSIYPTFTWKSPIKDAFGNLRPANDSMPADLGWVENGYIYTTPNVSSIKVNKDSISLKVKLNANDLFLDSTLLAVHIYKHGKIGIEDPVSRLYYENTQDSHLLEINHLPHDQSYDLTVFVSNGLDSLSPSVFIDSLNLEFNQQNCDSLFVEFYVNQNASCLNDNEFEFRAENWRHKYSITKTKFQLNGQATNAMDYKATEVINFTYDSSLIDTAILAVENSKGCLFYDTQVVRVFNPIASFVILDSIQCFDKHEYSFVNTTKNLGSANYTWDFADSSYSFAVQPKKVFTKDGVYRISLVVDESGCLDTFEQELKVYGEPDFSIIASDSVICDSGLIEFNLLPTNYPIDSLNIQWVYTDGYKDTGNLISRNFDSLGEFGVKVLVTSSKGCRDSSEFEFAIQSKPIALFGVNDNIQCSNAEEFIFSDSSINRVGYGSLNRVWVLDNDTILDSLNFNYQFNQLDTFQAKLTVQHTSGCVDSLSNDLIVYDPGQQILIDSTKSICNSAFIHVELPQLIKADLQRVEWFYNGLLIDSVPNLIYKSNDTGNVNIEAHILTNNGCLDTLSMTKYLKPAPLIDLVSDSLYYCGSLNLVTINENIDSFTNGISRIYWLNNQLLDTFDYGYQRKILLSGAKKHHIRTRVQNDEGCFSEDSITIRNISYPTALFTSDRTRACIGDSKFNFTSRSTYDSSNNSIFYQWEIGSISKGVTKTISHQFKNTGIQKIKLSVKDTFGCSDSLEKTVRVDPRPNLYIGTNSPVNCSRKQVGFVLKDSTNTDLRDIEWYIDGSLESVVDSLKYTLDTAGLIQHVIYASYNTGCSDTLTIQSEFKETPSIRYSHQQLDQCFNTNIMLFSDSSMVAKDSIQKAWLTYSTSKDSINVNLFDTTEIRYQSIGSLNVLYVVEATNGCKDSSYFRNNIFENPTASFTVNKVSQCLRGNEFVYRGTSQPNNSNSTLYSTWDFDDGFSSTTSSDTISYTTDGVKKVKLIVLNVPGCLDSTEMNVTIQPNPEAKVIASDTTLCSKSQKYQLTDNSSVSNKSALSRLWVFDDMTVATDSIVNNKKFFSVGKHYADLISSTAFGCKDTIRQPLFVSEEPQADFGLNSFAQCLVGNNFKLTNITSLKSTTGTTNYLWDFGDGDYSSNYSTSHSYSSVDSFKISLKATSSYGCVSIKRKDIEVVGNPNVSMDTITVTEQCLDGNLFSVVRLKKSIRFVETSKWMFGSLNIGNSDTLKKSFKNAGQKSIKLITRNSLGCMDSSNIKFTVFEKPVAGFTVNNVNQCLNSQLFNFRNTSSISGADSVSKYHWIINDSLYAVSKDYSNYKRVLGIGSDKVILISESNKGCRDTMTRTINVHPNPNAKFTINDSTQCLSSNDFKFSNKSTIPNGALYFEWDYGDGNGDTLFNGNHSYQKFGLYKPQLVAKTIFGCADTVSASVVVYSEPNMGFDIQKSAMCLYGNEFVFEGTSINEDSIKTNYYFVHDGGAVDSALISKVSYQTTGIKAVKYYGETIFGCMDSLIKNVQVYNQPKPAFSPSPKSTCLRNNEFEFANNSSIAGSDSLKYVWYFGDGNSSTSISTKHSYSNADTFIVKLVSFSQHSCYDSIEKEIYVHPDPVATFSVNDSQQCFNGHRFTPNNQSTIKNGTLSFQWSFGNDFTSNSQNPDWVYGSSGNYECTLIASSSFGCADTTSKMVEVFEEPNLNFSVNNYEQCLENNRIEITNTSSINSSDTLRYDWYFDTTTIQNKQNPSFSFPSFGAKIIQLIGSTSSGCIDTLVDIVTLYPHPTSNFSINDSIQCLVNNDFIFQSESVIPFGSQSEYWSFGDGSFATQQISRHSYKSDGIYTVELVSISDFGCTDTIDKVIRATENPAINFVSDTFERCLVGNQFGFINQSSYNGVESVKYTWHVNDQKAGVSDTLNYSFSDDGAYKITLKGETDESCIDSFTRIVTIHPQGDSRLRVLDSSDCLFGNSFDFGNDSRVSGDEIILYSWDYGNGFIDTVFDNSPQSYEYGDTGVYRIRLITETSHNCRDTSDGQVVVFAMPEARIDKNSVRVCLNEQDIRLSDVSNSGFNASNRWIYSDTVIIDEEFVSPVFKTPGSYKIRLIAVTEFGCLDTSTVDYQVNPLPKTKIISNLPQQCLESNLFKFENLYKEYDNVTWDFDDGSFGSGNYIEQEFIDDGTFDVEMIVENDFGCLVSDTFKVVVHPTPEAIIDFENPCLNELLIIDCEPDINSGEIKEYRWNMGDGTLYSDSVPNHRYQYIGRYGIGLKIFSDKGCKYEFQDTLDVYPNPEAGISKFTGRATILKNRVGFRDSSYGAYTHEWDFGDNSDIIFDEREVFHEYLDTGWYNVSLVVGSYDYCYDTAYYPLYIWPDYNILIPSAFSPNDDQLNDEFHIRGNFHSIKYATWMVYNENGIEVFRSNDILDSWNGNLYNGTDKLPMGNYQVVLVVTDNNNSRKTFNSKVSLIR